MPLRKGQPSEAYKKGLLQKKDLRSRTPEERKEISRKGVEARIKKSQARKRMREQLDVLLKMDVKDKDYKKLMDELGIDDSEQCNQMLLMVALFKRGISGDVQAIKQIDDMTNGIVNEVNSTQPIVINISSASNMKASSNSNVEINEESQEADDEWADWDESEDEEDGWGED